MTQAPQTRLSLLLRLRDATDSEAWAQFTDIYGPLIFGFARRAGMQESDAADLVQEVMREVSQSIDRFEYDPSVGRFRSWLYKIAKRTVGHLNNRQRRQLKGSGDSAMLEALHQLPDAHADLEEIWDLQYERHLLRWAADQVRHHFQESTWQAFWRTAVEGQSPQAVAEELGLSVGSVYVARTRVMNRLSTKIREVDHSD